MLLHSPNAPMGFDGFTTLPASRRELVEGWARTQRASSYVWHPTTVQEIREIYSLARSHRRTVVLLGGRHSYNDAVLNAERLALDISQRRRVLAWNHAQGIIQVEPGVTIGDIWRTTMADGWWLAVAPGTMGATLGGCLSMNVHGRNAWKKGSIGEQVLTIELLLASGDLIALTPSSHPDLFHAIIGGMGMIGAITGITLQLQPIQSGQLFMRQRSAHSLSEMLAIFAEESEQADYLEGWIDGYAKKQRLGRGFVTTASFSKEPDPPSLRPSTQIASNVSGMVHPQLLGWLLRAFLTIESRLFNEIYYRRGFLRESRHVSSASLVQFHFHSDDLFRFLRVLLPAGFRSAQPFVPAEQAPAVFKELLERSQQAELVPVWTCLKHHRADPFLLSCQVDGFSLELIYPVTFRTSGLLALLLKEMRDVVIASGGRFYLAKDDLLDLESYVHSVGRDRVERFLAIKRAYDTEGLFQSGLFQRIFTEDCGE